MRSTCCPSISVFPSSTITPSETLDANVYFSYSDTKLLKDRPISPAITVWSKSMVSTCLSGILLQDTAREDRSTATGARIILVIFIFMFNLFY